VTRLIVGFVLLRMVVLLTLSNPGDVRRYHGYAQKRAEGLAVYRDFAFEYPPLAYGYIIPAYSRGGKGVALGSLTCPRFSWGFRGGEQLQRPFPAE
jgi:hypothetical protein